MGEREVRLIRWTLSDPQRGPGTFRFEEAIDPSTGRIVQQVAFCGTVEGAEGNETCRDDRAKVHFGASGLPGAFGAAPIWGERVAANQTYPVDPLFAEQGNARVQLHAIPRPGCLQANVTSLDTAAGGISVLEPTVARGPVALCDDRALPVQMETVGGERFHLVDIQGADAAAEPLTASQENSVARDARGPVKLRNWSPPLLVADPSDPTPFSVRRAHAEAMNRSDPYRDLFERKDALLLSTQYRRSREGMSGSEASEHLLQVDVTGVERELVGATAEGRTVSVTIERRELPGGAQTYHLVQERQGRLEVSVTEASLAPRQARIGDAIRLARALTGQPIEDALGVEVSTSVRTYSWLEGVVRERRDGYTIHTWHEDPAPERRGGLLVQVPYMAAVDGPTGGLLYSDVNRSDLPLHEHRRLER